MTLEQAQVLVDANQDYFLPEKRDSAELAYHKFMVANLPMLLARTPSPQRQAVIKRRHCYHVSMVLAHKLVTS